MRHRTRTPTFLQMETGECGSAALGIILAYYGKWMAPEELRRACRVSRDGVNATNIVAAAQFYGLEAAAFQLELEQITKNQFPFIAFWNFNHFVVVEGYNHKYVFINDPAYGPRKVAKQTFSDSYSGIAIVFSPSDHFKAGKHQPSSLRLPLRWLSGAKQTLFLLAIVSLLLALPSILVPAFLKIFIDEILILNFNTWLFPLVVGMLLSTLLSVVTTGLQQYIILRIRTKLSLSSASQFFWHVLRVPIGFFEQRYIGDITARVNDCQNITALITGGVATSIVNIVLILFFLIIMFIYSSVLTAIVIGFSLVSISIFILLQRQLRDLNNHLLNQSAKLQSISMMGIKSIETLKANGTEGTFFEKWAGYQMSVLNTNQRVAIVSNILNVTPQTINNLSTAFIYGVGGLLIINGHLTMGGLIAFTYLMSTVSEPLQQFIGFASSFQQIRGDINRIQDVFNYQIDPIYKEKSSKSSPVNAQSTRLSGHVKLEQMSYAFDETGPAFIQNIDLMFSRHKTIAVVGKTGSGKSTLARLLLGLYRPTQGTVRYDGLTIDEIARSVFTTSVSYVDQNIVLFPGTIRDNLTMWDHSIPDAAVIKAAQDACIHEVISGRPGGYFSQVGEGGYNFSGGQAQRLEIAKALVLNPTVLILDEATAALDTLTESKVYSNIQTRQCALFIISHRLSTIKNCDEIIVLDRGKIVERGTHDSLYQQGGIYSKLMATDFMRSEPVS